MPSSSVLSTIKEHGLTIPQRFGKTTLLVVLLWLVTLWWGERLVFKQSAAACEWQNWESWPQHASPHHVLFIADPQLVDPHTYPGRPWPLSTLTVLYTDLYLRRMYGYLLHHTQPHSTLFLGDLFDGGREWATPGYQSPEDRYKKYGTNFWLREYHRFMKIFVDGWHENSWNGYLTGEGRRIIASLPGNHDLGFAGGINQHVRNRFEAHFGPSNRIDVLGNHTFVSLDTVSLSAMDQVDPQTGSSGAGDGTGLDTEHMHIWKPVENFLIDAKRKRAEIVQRRYQHIKSLSMSEKQSKSYLPTKPKAGGADDSMMSQTTGRQGVSISSSNFPTILLSHVPLFRSQDVTCGPLRERGNAIPLSAGYQYQNVLTPAVSRDIIDHLDAEQVKMIYSGDDHDYCEIEHDEFTGSIKEITVKSISWAMGVRKPGVQLASLWNPINMEATKDEGPTSTPRDTIQNHLCLLPDQLGIFIRYGQILALSLIVLVIRAILYNPQIAHQSLSSSTTERENSEPLLPITRKRTPPSSPQLQAMQTPTHTNTSILNHTARARSNGKLTAYANVPPPFRLDSPLKPDFGSPVIDDTDDWGMPKSKSETARGGLPRARTTSLSYPIMKRESSNSTQSALLVLEKLANGIVTPAKSKMGEFARSLSLVAGLVLLFYSCLLWNG